MLKLFTTRLIYPLIFGLLLGAPIGYAVGLQFGSDVSQFISAVFGGIIGFFVVLMISISLFKTSTESTSIPATKILVRSCLFTAIAYIPIYNYLGGRTGDRLVLRIFIMIIVFACSHIFLYIKYKK